MSTAEFIIMVCFGIAGALFAAIITELVLARRRDERDE